MGSPKRGRKTKQTYLKTQTKLYSILAFKSYPCLCFPPKEIVWTLITNPNNSFDKSSRDQRSRYTCKRTTQDYWLAKCVRVNKEDFLICVLAKSYNLGGGMIQCNPKTKTHCLCWAARWSDFLILHSEKGLGLYAMQIRQVSCFTRFCHRAYWWFEFYVYLSVVLSQDSSVLILILKICGWPYFWWCRI